MMLLTKRMTFDSAHQIIDSKGKLEPVHGHTWTVEVTLKGSVDSNGIVFDFIELEEIIMKKVISIIDHNNLNNILVNPSTENVAIWIWNQLIHLPLYKISVWENPTSYVTYFGEVEED